MKMKKSMQNSKNDISNLLITIKEEAALMFREDRAQPIKEFEDMDRALRSDFCRYMTILIKRVEKTLKTGKSFDENKITN